MKVVSVCAEWLSDPSLERDKSTYIFKLDKQFSVC